VKGIPLNPLTSQIARRVIWFEAAEQALARPERFLAYAMTYARHEDMQVIRRYVSDDDFREALDLAPPGIIDPRSWAYWNLKMGRYPAPPMPVRRFAAGHLRVRVEKPSPEEQRERAIATWLEMKRHNPTVDPEETRRRAREEWAAKYGPKSSK
jgi:hypothetical protein